MLDEGPLVVRAPFYGATFVFALTVFGAVARFPFALAAGRLDILAKGLLAAPILGAGAGLVYAVVGAPLRRVPHVGPYVAGIITAAAYFYALVAMVPILTGADWSLTDQNVHIAVGICALLFGVALGDWVFKGYR